MPHLHAVILAGGRGERFWPLSRRSRPKQFLPLFGQRTMLQETAARFEGWVPSERIWCAAGRSLCDGILAQLPMVTRDRIVAEPVARNTAAAIAAAAALIEERDPGALMLVTPSDHWIPDPALFREDVERASTLEGRVGGLHLFGVPPAYPETGYGYVEAGRALEPPGCHEVVRFHEKPDRDRAIAYMLRPEMTWNAGIFLWGARTILEALHAHVESLRESLAALRAALHDAGSQDAISVAIDRFFEAAPSESIDYAVLEKSDRAFVTRARFRWSDVGTWNSWADHVSADGRGNRVSGAALLKDSDACIVHSSGEGVVALLGVRDLIVVRLPDVTMVCAADRAQDVRELVREAAKDARFAAFL